MKVRNVHGKKAHGGQELRAKRHQKAKWSRAATKAAKRAQ